LSGITLETNGVLNYAVLMVNCVHCIVSFIEHDHIPSVFCPNFRLVQRR